MTLLLAAALGVPLVAAVASAATSLVASRRDRDASPRARQVVPLAGLLAAIAWAVLASVGEPPRWGSLVAPPSVVVAAAGVAALVAAFPPERPAARSIWSTGLTVFAVGACANGVEVPDRALAGGIAAFAFMLAVGAVVDGAARGWTVLSTAGAVAVAAGVALDDADLGALVAVGGTAVVLAVAMLRSDAHVASGTLALPALVLAVSETVALADRADVDRIGIAGAVLGFVVSVASFGGRKHTDTPGRDWLALAVVGAGMVVLTQDLPDAMGAGLLVVAGGVLALAARQRVGLVAAVPGITAALVAFGPASEPVHAAAGAAAVLLLLAGCSAPTVGLAAPKGSIPRLVLLAAVAFGVLPAWGWAGVALPDHATGLATAAALALPVMVLAASPLPGGSWQATGRITRRRDTAATTTHGSTIREADREVAPEEAVAPPQEPRSEEEDRGQEQDGREEEFDQEAGEQEDGTTKRPVAVPPQPVLVRARLRGTPLRGRVRARSGRTP